MTKPSIAIIGAGLSGLTVAKQLADVAQITLFDKSRGVSGRMATRVHEGYMFDHGTQFFTARTREFRDFLAPYLDSGHIKVWKGTFAELDGKHKVRTAQWDMQPPHYVAAPKMTALCKQIAKGMDIKLETKIDKMHQQDGQWVLESQGQTLGQFDWLIVTCPPIQALELIPESFADIDRVRLAQMIGCYSLMIGFDEPLDIGFDCALVHGTDISWISVNSSKPGRTETYTLMAHSTNLWAQNHIDDELDKTQSYLLSELSSILDMDLASKAKAVQTHRWRYANIAKQSGKKSLFDPSMNLGLCGDWCIHGRVEAAFLSANHLAGKLKEQLA